MKKLMILIAFMAMVMTVSADNKQKKQPTIETVTFNVSMHCVNCKKKIEGTVGWEKGVKDMKTNLKDKTVTIKYDARKTTPEKLQKSIEKLGYKAEVTK